MTKVTMKDFKSQEVDRIKGKKYSEVTYAYTRKDNKTFHVKDVSTIYKSVVDDLRKKDVYDKAKILVGVSNGMNNYWTLKGFKDDDIRLDDYDDYFRGAVKQKDKFEQVAKVRVTIAVL
jgi:hypothetical protein